MKLSTKGRYGLRALIDLAMHCETEAVSISCIAMRQGISESYLEQLMGKLRKAGLIVSVRGAQGGYRLAKEPKEYTVGMILRLTEGNMNPVACLEDEINQCERADSCVTLRLWTMLDDAIKGVIDRVTLQDMLDWSQEKGDNYII